MSDLAKSIMSAPISTLLILAGIIFLLIAVVGNISGKIEPGPRGRLLSGIIGVLCMAIGIWLQAGLSAPSGSTPPAAVHPVAPSGTTAGSASTQANETSVAQIPLPKTPPRIGSSHPADTDTRAVNTPTATFGRFEGRVTDEEGAALRVQIELANKTVRSDNYLGGVYVFPEVAPGVYSVAVKREEFDSRAGWNGKGAHIRPQIIHRVPIYPGKRTWLHIVASEGEDLQEIAAAQTKIDDAVQGGPTPK